MFAAPAAAHADRTEVIITTGVSGLGMGLLPAACPFSPLPPGAPPPRLR